MNKIKLLGTLLLLSIILFFSSCNDYLEVTLLDQMTREEVFSKRPSTEAYLSHIYSYLPREFEYLGEGSAVPRSDEALFS